MAFAAATLAFLFLQGFVLQFLSLAGAMPFLYPVLVAVLAMWEGPVCGTAYGLVLGVLCDLTIAAPIPCFYTLIFPLAGLFSAVLARSWLPAGFMCSLIVSVLSFFVTDLFFCVVLALSGSAAWGAGMLTFVRETAATILFVPLVYLLFRPVHRRFHSDD